MGDDQSVRAKRAGRIRLSGMQPDPTILHLHIVHTSGLMPHATRNQKDVQQIGATWCRFLQIRCGYRRITKAIDESHLPLGLSVLVSSSVTGRTAALSQPKSLLHLRENVRINSTTRYFYVLYLYTYTYMHTLQYFNVLACFRYYYILLTTPPPPPPPPHSLQHLASPQNLTGSLLDPS